MANFCVKNDYPLRQVALLQVAYTKGTNFKLAVRPPPEEITCFDEWSS